MHSKELLHVLQKIGVEKFHSKKTGVEKFHSKYIGVRQCSLQKLSYFWSVGVWTPLPLECIHGPLQKLQKLLEWQIHPLQILEYTIPHSKNLGVRNSLQTFGSI